ncbi:hypothetical protein, partial [Hymenobacter fodinae]|uniref:hypothetical protein n=1 Tax=Hymenobacter fodinae TaxID=2510796 RepID=UPI001436791A
SLWPALAPAQTLILNASPSAQPGEAVNLQGHFSAAAQPFLAAGATGPAQPLPVLVQSPGQLTVQLPASLPLDLYQLWVEDQGQRSPRVPVNRARVMHFDSPDITPGGSLRLFGRNLRLGAATPTVRFVPAEGGSGGGPATVELAQSDAYCLRVTAPASLVPGTRYELLVSNGAGASAGEVRAEQSV